MNIQDFLIDPAGKDWTKLLAYWTPPLPAEAKLWFVNMLGEAFLVASSGKVLQLVVGTGAVIEIAESREAFARLIDDPRHANAWLRIQLVESCRKAGVRLAADECYGFKVPPALLGQYESTNLQPANIYSHYSWLSHLRRQDEVYWTGD